MTWEGTDNQAATAGFDLSVFTGGPLAQAAMSNAGDIDTYFAKLINPLYPGYGRVQGTFSPTIFASVGALPGYSCPGVNEVTQIQFSYTGDYNGRLFVAGEHTSPRWFGFMEGALESGLLAAARVLKSSSASFGPSWSGFSALEDPAPAGSPP